MANSNQGIVARRKVRTHFGPPAIEQGVDFQQGSSGERIFLVADEGRKDVLEILCSVGGLDGKVIQRFRIEPITTIELCSFFERFESFFFGVDRGKNPRVRSTRGRSAAGGNSHTQCWSTARNKTRQHAVCLVGRLVVQAPSSNGARRVPGAHPIPSRPTPLLKLQGRCSRRRRLLLAMLERGGGQIWSRISSLRTK